jgi:hypothetical protein
MTNSMAARSTKPCFSGETPFIFHDLHADVQPIQVKAK